VFFFLEAQVEVDHTSDTNSKNEKRDIARQLKNGKRKLDEKKSEVGRDKRKIEALTKQVTALKERQRKLTMEISDLETEQHTLKRETSTLATQVEATQYSNAKLHVLVPTSISINIEEEASTKYPQPKEQPPPQTQSHSSTTRKKRSEVKVPPRDIDKPVEHKQTYDTHDTQAHYTPDIPFPQDTHDKMDYDDRLDSKDRDIDFDKLEKDLDTKVKIDDDLGNLEELVRESEQANLIDDPDTTIVDDE